MMIVCIELRIPLFLVGKPGSSKSLAKTIVHDAMQGDAARSRLFREFKLVGLCFKRLNKVVIFVFYNFFSKTLSLCTLFFSMKTAGLCLIFL